MAIQKTRDPFGIKYVIIYDHVTFKPIGLYRSTQEMSLERTIETNDLNGGHFDGALDSEFLQPVNAITLTIRELPFFSFTVLEGATTTEVAAETLGDIGAIANKFGTSVVDATTGIASVAAKAGQEANIKGVKYVFVATSATEVDIHLLGDGTPFETIDAIVASGVTIPDTGGTVDVDSLGITITGGSGSVAMTVGDTAYSDTRPIHNGFGITPVGTSGATPSAFGLMGVYPLKADGAQYWIDFPNVVGRGLPIGGTTREWSETSLTLTPLVDCNTDRLYTMYSKLPSDVC